jgi:putative nucleotidyltransferase with HDIG domain
MSDATVRAAARAGTVAPTRVAAAAERLSAPSAVVEGALRLLDEERASMRHLAERVGQSPELAAKVLRLGSSAIYGGSAATLDQAVVRVGIDSLRALLLAANTYPLLAGSLPVFGLPAMTLVRRSNDVAELAQALAERADPSTGAQAHVAGLLADIGMPILSQVAIDADVVAAAPLTTLRQERAVFGTDHVRVGAWISRRWSLSSDLAEAVHRHHDDEPPDAPTARVVWLAGMIVRAREGDVPAAEGVAEAARACGVDDRTLESLLMGDEPESATARPPDLTDREFEVLGMLAEGLAPKQVALQLGCSASTVHNHLHHVYRKLGVSGQAHALLLARDRGWV